MAVTQVHIAQGWPTSTPGLKGPQVLGQSHTGARGNHTQGRGQKHRRASGVVQPGAHTSEEIRRNMGQNSRERWARITHQRTHASTNTFQMHPSEKQVHLLLPRSDPCWECTVQTNHKNVNKRMRWESLRRQRIREQNGRDALRPTERFWRGQPVRAAPRARSGALSVSLRLYPAGPSCLAALETPRPGFSTRS